MQVCKNFIIIMVVMFTGHIYNDGNLAVITRFGLLWLVWSLRYVASVWSVWLYQLVSQVSHFLPSNFVVASAQFWHLLLLIPWRSSYVAIKEVKRQTGGSVWSQSSMQTCFLTFCAAIGFCNQNSVLLYLCLVTCWQSDMAPCMKTNNRQLAYNTIQTFCDPPTASDISL